MQFCASGCWCRREDSNLHGVTHPTRSLAWRVFQFRHSDDVNQNPAIVRWISYSRKRSARKCWRRTTHPRPPLVVGIRERETASTLT